jgi:drug/metabolite transporter (DMT)-like permease
MRTRGLGTSSLLTVATPIAFVVLWSSAFVAIRAGLPDVSPLYFLTLRFAIATAALFVVSLFLGIRWQAIAANWRALAVAGCLINAVYLSGGYLALVHLPAATMALIGSLHPVLTALIAAITIGERLSPWQWMGLGLGIIGVGIVVENQVAVPAGMSGVLFGTGGVVALAVGTVVYRARCREVPLREANLVQLGFACLACALFTLVFEDASASWTPTSVATLLYLALVVSLGATVLLMVMLRHGAAGKAASNFYLTPGMTAILGFLLLGEPLGWQIVLGLAVASLGVWLANRPGPRPVT